jgi:hypothetical protein
MSNFFESNAGLPTESYHLDEKLLVLKDQYAQGEGYNDEVFTSTFGNGEGWTGVQVVQNQSVDYTLTGITQVSSSGPQPTIEMVFVGRGQMQHRADIYVAGSFRTTVNFVGYAPYQQTIAISNTDITSDGKLAIQVRVVGVGNTDRISVSSIKLTYAQLFNAENASLKTFSLATNTNNKSYIEIANAPAGARLFDISNADQVKIIGTTSSSTLNAIVPGTNSPVKILAAASVITPKVMPVSFRQLNPSDYNFIIITHPLLQRPAGGYSDPVKAYAAYRASTEGGAYDTLVLNIRQLYDQFNYGETSPRAIFNVMKFLSNPKPPKYLMLIGKGMDLAYGYYRSTATANWTYKDLVPTAGTPGSDTQFSVGLGGTPYVPAVPTGRLTAMKSDEVAAYLNKVKEMEALPYDQLWRKDLLHLSGGIEEGEPEAFKSFLQDYELIAEGKYLGGKVSAIAKKSRDVQVINIAEQVNKGLNLVTFFGHSSPTTLDFDIGYVSNPVMGYNNQGKYPMLIMNGCEAGAFFLYDKLFGEDWVLADKKGATGFIAHSSYGLVSVLKQYTETLYTAGYADSSYIKKGIGDIQRRTIQQFLTNNSPNIISLSQSQQMILLGDPAVKLFGAPKADLEISNNNVSIESFTSDEVTALADSFAIRVVIRNFGIAPEGQVRLEVVRTLNDNTTLTYDSIINMTKYSDTLSLVIRKGDEAGFGNNAFKITIDPDNIISEITKSNNTATLNYFIPLSGTKNLFPYNYAIVNNKSVDLSLQSTDLLSAERDYLVELDTACTFDSPYKQQFTVKGKVLARLKVSLLDQDSLAYYWRTRYAQPAAGERADWTNSSFTYIKNGPEGWAQVQFPQYLQNATDGLIEDQSLRRITFKETKTAIDVITFGGSSGKPRDSVSVKIDGQEYNLYTQEGGGFGCRMNTINLIAFDRRSTVPYVGIYFKWYEILYTYGGRRLVCGREPFVINSFTPSELSTGNHDDLIQYVDNVALGDSVILYNIGDAGYASWPAAAKTKLGELGISVSQIDNLQAGEPVVIFGRKGSAPGSATVYRSSSAPLNQASLKVHRSITGRYTSGSMSSTVIGPATTWQSLKPRVGDVEASDVFSFDVMGIRLNNTEQVLLPAVHGLQDLSFIDANEYPYLRLKLNVEDNVNLTPTQLIHWIVSFTPAPEGLLLYDRKSEKVELTDGEVWKDEFHFINISEKTFSDSLAVQVSFFNHENNKLQTAPLKIAAPAPGDTTSFNVKFQSTGLTGFNDVDVFVNPHVLPEQYYDNNVIRLNQYLHVLSDELNPVLDVTIDGRYVKNGEYVSANPNIVIKLWDENKFSLKTDTTGVLIFLTYPCGSETCAATRIYFKDPRLKWYPATSTSDFKVEFNPGPLDDGIYQLRVEAKDSKGNASGADPYIISFEVKNDIQVLFNKPFPNPFQSDVYFTYVLTGSKAPDEVRLIITDLTGREVRSIDASDPSFVGSNTFIWDGSDGAGRILSGGLFLYRIQVRMDQKLYQQQGKIIFLR